MKKLLCLSLVSTLVFSTPIFANTTQNEVTKTISSEHEEVNPLVNWTGGAYLVTSNWSNVTSSNNFFPDSPLVSNHASNAGTIQVRIVNSSGVVVGTAKSIAAGSSVRMDRIPALSGTYTLQARAVSVAGNYTITIN